MGLDWKIQHVKITTLDPSATCMADQVARVLPKIDQATWLAALFNDSTIRHHVAIKLRWP